MEKRVASGIRSIVIPVALFIVYFMVSGWVGRILEADEAGNASMYGRIWYLIGVILFVSMLVCVPSGAIRIAKATDSHKVGEKKP